MAEWKRGNVYLISTDKSKLDIETIHHFLNKESYWAKGITKERVQRSIEHSLCFGLYIKEQNSMKQVGFARLITDYVSSAYLCDVFVLEEYRGRGLSKWLLETVTSYEELQEVRGMTLVTKDAHGLYKQYGFKPVEGMYMKKAGYIESEE